MPVPVRSSVSSTTVGRGRHALRPRDGLAKPGDVLGVELTVRRREQRDRIVQVTVSLAPQVGVSLSRLDERDPDTPRRDLHAQGVGHPLQRELALYGPNIGVATRPLTDETKTRRPRGARSRGSTAWVTAACPTTFDFQLPAELGQGHRLHRPGHDHAGVVD